HFALFDLLHYAQFKSQRVIPLTPSFSCIHLTLLSSSQKVSTYFRTGQAKQKGQPNGLAFCLAAKSA
ncbi:MAG: hypothetical protein U1C96_08040, partial [Gallionella sp.]|nr:hypothetical protein [Gallionella sp.]